MTMPVHQSIFLAYAPENEDVVEAIAVRLQGDARLSVWFAPWHSVPGEERQQQMELALDRSQACAIFVSSAQSTGWQDMQMRTAIQARVEDAHKRGSRVIPVLLPGEQRPSPRDLPPFLRLFELVEFRTLDDERAFKRLLAGLLGVPPIAIDGYVTTLVQQEQLPPPAGAFDNGHALLIGVAQYAHIRSLPDSVRNDVHALQQELQQRGGYRADQINTLLDAAATGDVIRAALRDLAARTGPDDTAIVFFSGHGAHNPQGDPSQQYLLPYDCDPFDLETTALRGDELTTLLRAIPAGRLLVLFDSCHSGGAAEPKSAAALPIGRGLSEDAYQALAEGVGRVVIASSRPDEESLVLRGMDNSLFTHYLLEALRGGGPTLGDGYVRVFDLFRHIAKQVPARASQHPIFKAACFEDDFPIALARPA